MRIEIPEFTRCCIFFPLRQSLMIWACIRVLVAIGILLSMSITWMALKEKTDTNPYELLVAHAEWLCFVIIVTIFEIILGLVYIVASQLKYTKLMNYYYYHNIFVMVLTLSLHVYNTIWFIVEFHKMELFPIIDYIFIVVNSIMVTVSDIALQAYGVLLIRSELKKLATGSDYMFENPVAEETLNIVQSNEKDYKETEGEKKEREDDKKGTEDDKKETNNVEEIIQIES